MHVPKPYYINMYVSIDEPFWFNASLRHILVNVEFNKRGAIHRNCDIQIYKRIKIKK